MFFSINRYQKENFPCSYQVGNFVINTDTGWSETTVGNFTVVYKGYIDQHSIENSLAQLINQSEPVYTGNFCAFVFDPLQQTISVKTDKYRSFPIFVSNGHSVTNLTPAHTTIWSKGLITINRDLNVHENNFNLIGKIDTAELSADVVIERIDKILDEKTKQLADQITQPIKVFLSGGVDTMLVYSYLKKHNVDHALIKGSYFDWDYFWIHNSDDIQKFWAYNQLLHWNNKCILASGAPGDEFMLRSPTTADLFLKHHGIEISSLLQLPQWQDCLHRDYFLRPKHTHIFESQSAQPQKLAYMHHQLCNIVVNDWQHWHLGHTLTWTPLRDLEIFKLFLRLPIDDAIGQILDSKISKQIIDRNVPNLSKHISNSKNSGNVLSNLAGLIV